MASVTPSTAPLERYPLGTHVHAAVSLDPDARIVEGIIRGYVLRKDRVTGELGGGEALLRTDDGTIAVPIAAIRGSISAVPARWERWVLWAVIVVGLVVTLWAMGRINGVARAATMWAWRSYVPVAADACPSVPIVGFCPAPSFGPTPTITPTPEPIVVPGGGGG